MLLDPAQLESVPTSEILNEVARGRLDIDHRVLRALLERPADTLSALLEFAQTEDAHQSIDIEVDIAQLFHALEASEGIPFLVEVIRLEPQEIPDEVVEALHFFGQPAIDALLALYETIDESESEEIAFLLATFHIRDQRIFRILLDRLEFDVAEGAFLLGIYGDPAATPHLERVAAQLSPGEEVLRKELDEARELLATQTQAVHDPAPLDIYSKYPREADLPIDLLPEEDRLELLDDPRPAIRTGAARSFFNQHLGEEAITKLLHVATSDLDQSVRARAWEALVDATEHTNVVEAMLEALRNPAISVEERAGVLIGLSLEADRNEVRHAIEDLYHNHPEARAKALEAMWRSLHPSFRNYFAQHLDDDDLEIRRSAVWGVGYYAIKPALDKVRTLFDDEGLRSDAIFAYGLALPTDISKGRVKGLLKRIEKDAGGLSELEERLAMTALDERLMLSGKEPAFFPED